MRFTLFAFLLFLALLFLLPLLFGQLMLAGLAKLDLSPGAAMLLMLGIIFGGMINIPVKRIALDREVPVHPLAIFGMNQAWPGLGRTSRETIIAVNVGGCLIPGGLAIYELSRIAALGPHALQSVLIAAAANTLACYLVARPVSGVGVVMPGLLSPLVAALLAVTLEPDHAAPVAFVAGVAGPLIGADLLHLRDVRPGALGIASIGGAGTFDGIVLSGIVAAYLA